jgi:hypothetical protein
MAWWPTKPALDGSHRQHVQCNQHLHTIWRMARNRTLLNGGSSWNATQGNEGISAVCVTAVDVAEWRILLSGAVWSEGKYFHETVLEHQKRLPLCLLKHYFTKQKVRRPFPLSLQMTFQVLHLEESECTVMTSRKKHKSFRGVDSEEASEEGLGPVEEDKVNGWREREDREEGGVSKGFGIGTKQPDQT